MDILFSYFSGGFFGGLLESARSCSQFTARCGLAVYFCTLDYLAIGGDVFMFPPGYAVSKFAGQILNESVSNVYVAYLAFLYYP